VVSGARNNDGLDSLGSIPGRERLSCPPQLPDQLWSPPASYLVGTMVSFPGIEAVPEYVTYNSLLSGAEAKNDRAVFPLPHVFMV
jgi:hypothetical protein